MGNGKIKKFRLKSVFPEENEFKVTRKVTKISTLTTFDYVDDQGNLINGNIENPIPSYDVNEVISAISMPSGEPAQVHIIEEELITSEIETKKEAIVSAAKTSDTEPSVTPAPTPAPQPVAVAESSDQNAIIIEGIPNMPPLKITLPNIQPVAAAPPPVENKPKLLSNISPEERAAHKNIHKSNKHDLKASKDRPKPITFKSNPAPEDV